MKKAAHLLIGFAAGAIFMFSSQIYGAGSLTGEKVDNQMNVTLNNKLIGPAAVINGTSYIPVRALANELKMKVNVSGGDINLMTSTDAQQGTDIGALKTQRSIIQEGIDATKASIKGLTDTVIPELEKGTSSVSKLQLSNAKKHLADFQKELGELEKQLEDIDNQIAAAESE